jgi:CRISPR-associated protein Csb2
VAELKSVRSAGRQGRGRPYLAGHDGHDHAHYLPTAEGGDRQRVTHVTVFARCGFDPDAVAALTGVRTLRVGELTVRAQMVGLGRPSDFRAGLFGGPDGRARVWVSATPFVGPAHVGRSGRARYLRKAVRRELRRWLAGRGTGAAVAAVEALPDTDPAWAGGPRPIEFHRGRSRAGDTGWRRPFGLFRVTLTEPLDGPLCLGYACHYGLGQFRPAEPALDWPER